jgi:hypothetical protein
MEELSIILSLLAFVGTIFNLLVIIDYIKINKPNTDKYAKHRNEDGLLGRKKDI